MSLIARLSESEFLSLVRIGDRLLPDEAVPSEHLMKLVGLRYVQLKEGRYEPTVAGLLRITSGS
jgi:hypothetical protein